MTSSDAGGTSDRTCAAIVKLAHAVPFACSDPWIVNSPESLTFEIAALYPTEEGTSKSFPNSSKTRENKALSPGIFIPTI